MPTTRPRTTSPVAVDWRWSLLALAGCQGPQSALDPAGTSAGRIAALFWWMCGGALAIWVGVVALALFATFRRGPPHPVASARRVVVAGGVVLPVIVLTGVLTYGLAMLPPLLAPSSPAALDIRVTGEQWWWRVRYLPSGRPPVDLANEIHLPVGELARLELDSRDVIHSFWIPALAGKADMIPGRVTRLALQPTRVGRFRGACAEYCGTAHAFMSFDVVVETRPDFDRWLANQAAAARAPTDPAASDGRTHFLANGCGACHTIRGTPAAGGVGPDLTHVGGRSSLAARRLAGTGVEDFRRWIVHAERLKPAVLMPGFGMLPSEQVGAISTYLGSLK